MIGKKIKSLIDSSGLKYLDVAKKLDITYQNLNRILNKESVETRYLFELAKILNVPVTAFYEDEPGGKVAAVDVDKLKNENTNLKNRIEELSEQLTDKRIIIIKLNSEIEYITEKLSKKTQEKIKISDLYEYYLNEADKEFPVFMQLINSDIEDRKEGWEEEILKASKRRREICEEKFLNDPEIKKHIEQGKTIEYFRKIFKSF